jgi:S-DNA-T family DNA segregation ATPase FtsK/SpoIIIE
MPQYHWTTQLSTGEIVTCTAALAATAATAGIQWDVPAAAPLLLGAASGGATALFCMQRDATPMTTTVRVATQGAAAVWSSWFLATGSPPGSMGWLAGAVEFVLGLGLNWAVNYTEPERAKQAAVFAWKKQAAKTLDVWSERIERLAGFAPEKMSDIQPWPKEAGYTLVVDLPGGKTFQDLKAHETSFASDLKLGNGCGVEVARGANRAQAIIRVSTRDMFSADEPYPADFSELTINDPFAFAFHRDGTDSVLSFLDDCGILIGETGSGKTNTLNNIIMQFARMPDVLVWVIDITGAGVALPWIAPWAIKEKGREVQAAAPVVDWVAYNPAEALVMLRMAIQIIATRKAKYQKRMRAANTDKLPVDHDVPSIMIVADEVAELPADIQTLMDSVVNTGRAVRVRSLNCGLRATQDTITAAMKKQAKNRIGMKVTDPEELSYLFAGYQQLDTQDAPVPGSGFYSVGGSAPRPMKVYRITPDIITSGCIACSGRRPTLDKISCSVKLYDKYETRWARIIPALFEEDYTEGNLADEVEAYLASLGDDAGRELAGNEGVDDPTISDAMDAANQAHGHAGGMPPLPSVDDIQAMFAKTLGEHGMPVPGQPGPPPIHPVAPAAPEQENEGATVLTMTRPAVQLPHPTPTDTITSDNLSDAMDLMQEAARRLGPGATREQISNEALKLATERIGQPIPERTAGPVPRPAPRDSRQEAYDFLWSCGVSGTGAKEISERLGESRTTVQEWLKKWVEDGRAVKKGSGSHAKYVHPEHAN